MQSVIQFGEGNFLRGFVDCFLYKMKQQGLFNGDVTVVQPIPQGRCAQLDAQHGKYNLFLRGLENGTPKSEHLYVDVITGTVNPYDDYAAYLALAHNADYRFIISNTTEAGIAFDASCRLEDAPAASFPGKLTQLLYERYKAQLGGFIILACELIDSNGARLKECVLRYAEHWALEPAFSEWIINQNTFADTLVDRIVTGFPEQEAQQLAPGDALLDTGELFHLWVIQGDFENELPLKKAGINVIWTQDAAPYKKRKVRILNGAHTCITPGALLAGLQTVGDCMDDAVFYGFLRHCLFEEILPVIGNTQDNMRFAADTLERFANPYIKHRLSSIALNSVSKFSVRVLPTLLEYREKFGKYPAGLVTALALLISFYRKGEPQDVPEAVTALKALPLEQLLKKTELWGTDLTPLYSELKKQLELIDTLGAAAAAEQVCRNK